MAGLLDGQLAKQIYAGFRNKLQVGALWRAQAAVSAGLDSFGDANATDVMTYPCQGFHDSIATSFKRPAGVPETDALVCVFGASLPTGIEPGQDDKVNIAGAWWQVRKVVTDPAKALWGCWSFQCKAPA